MPTIVKLVPPVWALLDAVGIKLVTDGAASAQERPIPNRPLPRCRRQQERCPERGSPSKLKSPKPVPTTSFTDTYTPTRDDEEAESTSHLSNVPAVQDTVAQLAGLAEPIVKDTVVSVEPKLNPAKLIANTSNNGMLVGRTDVVTGLS